MKYQKWVGTIAITIFLTFYFCLSPASAGNRNYHIKVMTQNMNPGPEVAAIAFADNPMQAISETIAKIIESRIPDRAAMVAAEIARTKPDLIALQEATKWEFITVEPDGTMVVTVLDQLDQLLMALNAAGQHYKVAAVHELTSLDLQIISYTDRDAVLVRSDLPPGQLKVLGSEIHEYDTLAQFPAFGDYIQVLRGWITVDMKANGSRFKFVATHLEAPIPGIIDPSIQEAQTDQLMEELKKSSFPIILAGDFNSDAETTQYYPPDATLSYSKIRAAGFSDAWEALYPNDAGYTWPLTLDPMIPDPPFERIDLVFTNGPQPISIERIGVNPVDGLFASDHVGIVAEFNLLGRHTTGFGFGRKQLNNGPANLLHSYWQKYLHRRF